MKKGYVLGLVFCLIAGTVKPLLAADNLGPDLMGKVMEQDLKGVQSLLKKGADVNYQDDFSKTSALMMAANYGMLDIAQALIEKGADVNLQDKNGATALYAAAGRSQEIVELLLANGADLAIQNNTGAGVFTSSIVGILMERIPYSLPEFLLEKGAEVDEAQTSGRAQGYTPLMMAARQGDMTLVKFLVKNGADVNAQAEDKTTPLSLAKKEKHKKVIKYLQKQGAKK